METSEAKHDGQPEPKPYMRVDSGYGVRNKSGAFGSGESRLREGHQPRLVDTAHRSGDGQGHLRSNGDRAVSSPWWKFVHSQTSWRCSLFKTGIGRQLPASWAWKAGRAGRRSRRCIDRKDAPRQAENHPTAYEIAVSGICPAPVDARQRQLSLP